MISHGGGGHCCGLRIGLKSHASFTSCRLSTRGQCRHSSSSPQKSSASGHWPRCPQPGSVHSLQRPPLPLDTLKIVPAGSGTRPAPRSRLGDTDSKHGPRIRAMSWNVGGLSQEAWLEVQIWLHEQLSMMLFCFRRPTGNSQVHGVSHGTTFSIVVRLITDFRAA